MEKWKEFEERTEFDGPPFVVAAQINQSSHANTLVDTGCTTYGLIDSSFAEKHRVERISIPRKRIRGYDGPSGYISEVARLSIDIGGNYQPTIYLYVVQKIDGHDIILGTPWMRHQQVVIEPDRSKITFRNTGLTVKSGLLLGRMTDILEVKPISAAAFSLLCQRKVQKRTGIQIFTASLRDIEKALRVKVPTDPLTKLPNYLHDYVDVFDQKRAEALPRFRGPGIDHKIELVETDETGKKPEVPWGPLYNMSREELLVLRKKLTEYLNMGFIRVSNSPAAAPVLLSRKPGGGLRFCVDYRALNKITRKDRYPLPLIHETLERISKAKWFTKLDVIAAFHKIRIAEGHEWLTAFRTRYGLYEWLVMPFGLANAPSTFQRYINWVLRDYLDEFVSAYLDDILIFTSGSRREHREQVRKVLERLREAGLQIDIDKCEFEVESTKYLGFIIEAGNGIRMDPEKVKAILEWEAPTTVKAVRAFLGFANFYRRFIRDFSKIVAPLTDLTKSTGVNWFRWTEKADQSFQKLKTMFTTAPVLANFDPDRETVVEADSSGWATGGVLSQYDNEGLLRPCAYFSKKNSPAECNYDIHDKELLAIICCLREWESELLSVREFKILTDHKNLRYFTTLRRLTERQMRWASTMSRFNFTITYRPGAQAPRPDALSRREQDIPKDINDDRLRYRYLQLLKPTERNEDEEEEENLVRITRLTTLDGILAAPAEPVIHTETATRPLDELLQEAQDTDKHLSMLKDAVTAGLPKFPRELNVKVSISECELDSDGNLLFRSRRWVPNSESLRTRMIQETHDSTLTGHPGRELTYATMARRWFWPGMSSDIRRFCRNCDKCGANTVWRDRRQGLLKPLPIPDRKWSEISTDFIQDLPGSNGYKHIMVIVDRLGKGVQVINLKRLDTSYIAQKFVKHYIPLHGIPRAITSDRGSQFVSEFWARVCQLLRITRRLSTAYHPETDGSTERANQRIEAYFRNFVNEAQDDWSLWSPIAALALNSLNNASTGVSPFFLDHGYELDPLDIPEDLQACRRGRQANNPKKQAEAIVLKLKSALDLANSSMALAQQQQEEAANRRRDPAVHYKIGDKVWLDLRHVKTDRQSKKLDVRNAKYTVLERIGSHAYRLNTPSGIHNVFHTWLLRPAASDPLPSQQQTDYQPPAIMVDGQEEWHVEKILKERLVDRGFLGKQKKYYVKWRGYQRPTWAWREDIEDTIALDEWETNNPPR